MKSSYETEMANMDSDGGNVDGLDLPTMEEIQNMKVADLKKKLKSFGLPITGNKTELLERLQDACFSGKDTSLDSFENEDLNFDSTKETEADTLEENDLLEDNFPVEVNASPAIDSSKPLAQLSVTKPLKKRALSNVLGVNDQEKKVHLNRTHLSSTDHILKPVSPVKTILSSDNKNTSDTKKVLSLKTMSESERLAMRAKRFNVTNAKTVVTSNKDVLSVSKPLTLSRSTNIADMDILKKRAQRFGQNVSTVMKQIEEKEKILKRKFKFGATVSAVTSLDEQEKKKRRAERFGAL